MARTWLSISVELLGGRGEELWPYPGRIFAVGPSHTFEDLAQAINTAFARWDFSHLSEFTLADNTLIVDPLYDDDLGGAISGPITAPLDMSTTKIARTVQQGDEFQFVFDLGDQWTHHCTVHTGKVDPVEVLGIRPKAPLAYWGWGDMPDQYGRRWENDDGESPLPQRPASVHPMLSHEWPTRTAAPALDMRRVRGAIYNRDAAAFVGAITGAEIDDALQQVALGAPFLLDDRTDEHELLVLSLTNRLSWRGLPGDHELANDLQARLQNRALPGREVPVNLEMLTEILEGDPTQMLGGYLDLTTGEAFPEDVADPSIVGSDLAFNIEADPDRFLWVDRVGGRDGWEDMAAFAQRQPDAQLRARLDQSLRGKGAFRAFRDIVHDTGLGDQWHIFSTDRQFGRARAFLATEGIRIV